MKPISLKSWIVASIALIVLGLMADYYFLHILFNEKVQAMKEQGFLPADGNPATQENVVKAIIEGRAPDVTNLTKLGKDSPQGPDNFLATLQQCLPEISSQGIATPEALMEYFKKSIGTEKEIKNIRNYHIRLPDGSIERVHLAASEESDGEATMYLIKEHSNGKLEEMPMINELPANDTTAEQSALETELKKGELIQEESRERWVLKDGSHLAVEIHNKKIFDFKYEGHGRFFNCHWNNCTCQ